MSDTRMVNDEYELSNDDLIATLIRRRATIKSSLTRVASFIARFNPSPASLAEAASRLNTLPSVLNQFEDVQQKIEEVDVKHDDEYHTQQREEFECRYHDIFGRLSRLTAIPAHAARVPDNDSNVQEFLAHAPWSRLESLLERNLSVKTVTHLPSLPLEKFDGDYTKWPRFYNCFMKRVNDANGLDEVDKLYFLRSCLQGGPLDLIDVLDVDASSYTSALSLLKDRYERKRFLVDTHVRSLLEMKNLASPASKDLRNFLSTWDKHVEALRSLKRPVEHWDDLLVGIVRSKLDLATLEKWDLSHKVNDEVTFKMLYDFLETRASSLESFEGQVLHNRQLYKAKVNNRGSAVLSMQKKPDVCSLCSQMHMIYHCPKFKSMSIVNRYSEVKKRYLCFNCLLSGHGTRECKSQCCRHCGKKHNSMLHGLPYQVKDTTSIRNRTSNEVPTVSQEQTEQPCMSSSNSTTLTTTCIDSVAVYNVGTVTQVLLSTAIVMVQNIRGQKIPCRAILDNGSQINVLTQRMARRLDLDTTSAVLPICGVNGVHTTSSRWTELSFFAVHSSYSKTVGCHILPAVTVPLPPQSFDVSDWSLPDNVRDSLADPRFNVSSEVDLLLGAETYYELVRTRPLVMPGGLPWLYDTVLGWVISGPLSNDHHSGVLVGLVTCALATTAWMDSETFCKRSKHEEELAFERSFQETYKRLENGRFIVRLPFREEPSLLGESMNMALKRFLTLEKKLCNNLQLAMEYKAFLKEYEELGHMSRIDDTISTQSTYYYIPHHAVFKEASSTTKLRVVFDASMKTTTNYSLNDILMTGPVVQQELFDILLRFRYHLYVLTSDVAKMYRQVLIHEDDRHFQRILWRDAPDKPLQHFVLNTITYGTVPASFLATRVLKELALGSATKYPKASLSILQDFYMDDYLSGTDSIGDAKTMYQQVSKILEEGGMYLRKWCSNAEELRNQFAYASTEDHYSLELSEDMTVSSLGLTWCPITDELKFQSKERTERSAKTKRDLLSTLNSVFDPLGFLGPVLIRGKVFLQELWQLKLNWDDKLPEALQIRWINFVQELEGLCQLSIPRAVKMNGQGVVELHGFCDASQNAYGACIYLRQQVNSNTWNNRLLCAKSRVAPIKTVTIPRLELSGALLLAELMSRVSQSIKIDKRHVYCWCDSTVVLAWIQGVPAQWKTYVANRITQIVDAVGSEVWRHVPTGCNPADPLSRGVCVNALLVSELWWNGPEFLKFDQSSWPCMKAIPTQNEEVSHEQRPIKFSLVQTTVSGGLLEYVSDWNKLLRFSAILARFIVWLRYKSNPTSPMPTTGSLTVLELKHTQDIWIRFAQRHSFKMEIQELSKGNLITKGPLKHLSPFMDNELLRVGGRLDQSEEPYTRKHPAILPRDHRITKLIFQSFHVKLLHIGPQGLLANVRSFYWPLRGRDVARATVNKCLKCFKTRPIPMQPPIGQLPAPRVSTNRPFTQTGVDFAGPIMIKIGLRKSTLIKAYVCVFVCLSTKATHLEPVSDLSADAFMACLRRFIARRGLPSHIWSDNATNFVGTRRELRRCYASQRSGRTVPEELINEGIQWVFIPPSAPHFGGLWEAAVKSFKHHFVRTISGTSLNFEELCTVLTQIESCLNSRPLTAISSDPTDYQALTPNHFLIGGSTLTIPELDVSDVPANRLRKWSLMQKLFQGFWKRWRREYLTSLQIKSKWLKNMEVIKIGSLAILKEDNAPPLSWPLVRIHALHPGKDQVTRVATIKTSNGHLLKRPLVKLCPLPSIEED